MLSPDQLRFLIFIAFFVLLLMGVKRPVYAVVAYMVLVYCKLSSYFQILADIHAEAVFAVAIMVRIALVGNLIKYLSVRASSINKYLLLLILSVILSFFFAWDRQFSWDNAVYHFIKTVVLYCMIVGALETKEDLKIFVWSFILMFACLAYEPAYYFVTGTSGSSHMYGTNYIAETGILSGHVALANNVNQMLPLVFFLFIACNNRWLRLAAGLSFIVLLIALIGSGSRGGIVGMLVWGGMLVWLVDVKIKKIMIAVLVIIAMFTGAGTMIMNTANRIDETSAVGRLIGLTHGIEMLRKGNVIGVGPGCYLIARQKYFSYRMESHNIYGQLIGDLGIPGIFATFLFIREVFRRLNQIKINTKDMFEDQFYYYLALGVLVSLVTRLIVSMASHGLYYFYWYAIAAIVVVSQRLIHAEEVLHEKKI